MAFLPFFRKTVERWDLKGERSNAQAQEVRDAESAAISEKIADLPQYKISDEANQRLALLEQAGVDIESAAQEQTDVARMKSGQIEGPGASQALRDIRSSTSGQVGALQDMGGSGFLSSITQVGLNERNAMKDYTMGNLGYRAQSESDLMSALRNQTQAQSQSSMLQAQGLEGMISERDKAYQSELSQAQTGLQYDITKLSMEQQNKIAENTGPKLFGLF